MEKYAENVPQIPTYSLFMDKILKNKEALELVSGFYSGCKTYSENSSYSDLTSRQF